MKIVFGAAVLAMGLTTGFAAHAESVEIHMKAQGAKFLFVPAVVNIKKGTTVKWVNDDPSKNMHTVTSGTVTKNVPKPDKKFDSKYIMAGKTFEHVFQEAGSFDYYCLPHTSMGMVGKVVVK